MKTIRLFLITSVILCLCSFTTSRVDGNEEGDYSIELSGNVLIPENDETRFYTLELFSDNQLLESGVVVDAESFLLRVKKNSLYTIRITKEGHSPLVISINTHVSGTDNLQFNFDDNYFTTLYGFKFFMGLQDNP